MPIERNAGIERPLSPETIRREFGTDMARYALDDGARRWAESATHRDNRIEDAYGEGMLQRLRGFREQTAAQVDAAETALRPAMAATDDGAEDRFDEILERLRAEPPDEAGDDAEHPYLVTTQVARRESDPHDPGAVPPHTLYKVDGKAVQADIDFLRSKQRSGTLTAEQSRQVDALVGLLNTFRFQDTALAAQRKADQLLGGPTDMTVAGKKMGRTLLFAIALTAAVGFGAMGIVDFVRRGKISLAPIIWGLFAWFLADPDMMKTFFDRDAGMKRDFEEAGTVTRSPVLARLSRTYGIGGPAWARYVADLQEGGHDDMHTAHPTAEAVEDYVSGQDPAVRDGLRAMFASPTGPDAKNDFQRFVDAIGVARSDGAKELLVAGIENDYFRNAGAAPAARARAGRVLLSSDFIRRAS